MASPLLPSSSSRDSTDSPPPPLSTPSEIDYLASVGSRPPPTAATPAAPATAEDTAPSAHPLVPGAAPIPNETVANDEDSDSDLGDAPEVLILSPSVLRKEEHLFTFRAVFVGCLLGSIISASNMYLGLTVGWHFGGALFGSIVGFAILKPLSRVLPLYAGGGYFGPKENCTVQSTASAAGGLSVGFVSAIPALYRLGLMSPKLTQDVGALILWSLAAAYFGLFFAIPLRRYFILKQKLVFPSPTVSAKTIQSLHDSSDGEHAGRAKAKVLMYAFLASFLFKCVSWWMPVLHEWHVLYYIGRATSSNALMLADVMWKWKIQIGGAFVGAGMLVGANTATSFFAGSVLSWAIFGPVLLMTGVVATSFGFPASLDPSKPLSPEKFQAQITAQYWILWPGVALMIATSFSELGARGPSLWRGIRGAAVESYTSIISLFKRTNPSATSAPKARFDAKSDDPHADHVQLLPLEADPVTGKVDENVRRRSIEEILEKRRSLDVVGSTGVDPIDEEEEDPAGPDEQVPVLWWSIGLLMSCTFTVLVLYFFFKIPPGQGLLAILVGFLLAFVGIQASGETDINPTGSIGKTSQFLFSAIRSDSMAQMLRTNLIAGQVASACASQTVDMVGDLKTAHLLRASPRSQFLAQAVGSLVAVFISVGLFVLFGVAYPCILTGPTAAVSSSNGTAIAAPAECPFAAPAVASWTAVSVALTAGVSKTIPITAAYAALSALLLSIVFTIIKYLVVPARYRGYLPNLNALGIAMVNPQPHIGISLAIGAIANAAWKAHHPHHWEKYAFAVASGLIAGEGIAGIVEAVYALAGLKRESITFRGGIPNATDIAMVQGWKMGYGAH
ncbi:OPT oligopeptide transporter protein-domain-containing protein [Zopfochytrium polystomum]|nr:OPT oligopeptide transporter protein-domain-containing protein [Zopfochytrium polystomum]